MAEKEIKIMFAEEKLEVLAYFLREQGMEMEKVLKDQVNKSYERNVPKEVRKFIESRMPSEESVQSAGQTQAAPSPRASRRNARQSARNAEAQAAVSENAAAGAADALETSEEVPEGAMTMEM